MNQKFTLFFFIINTTFCTSLNAQFFYHHEDFLNDSAFIVRNNIKVVNVRIPEIMGDSTKGYYPYQKFCFNPYGKLAWYEYDYVENNTRRKYYYLHYYNEQAIRFKSRIFQRCEEIDSLREEVRYIHDEQGRLLHEDHYQIFIQAYNEWSYSYHWEGDSLKIRMDELGGIDSTRLDANRNEIEYTYDNMRCLTEYYPNGKRKSTQYFWKNAQSGELSKNEEVHFFYDDSDKLTRIETDLTTITFQYDSNGLPTMSSSINKLGNGAKMYEIYYDYEFRDPILARKN